MRKFEATIEILRGQRAAIIDLTENGEWSGSSRIDLPRGSRRDLYELGHIYASRSAAAKGGRVETYREVS